MTTSTAAQRWQIGGISAGLAALAFAVFGQTLRYGFVNFDDGDYVYNNPIVQRGLTAGGVEWAFARGHAYNWHPLTWLSHMLDSQIYGKGPAGPHFTNVVLHAATAVVLFLALRAMTGALWRSAFVAAIFAIHPLRAESVAWISERKDVLSGFFFVLTLAAHAGYARRKSVARYGLVMLLYALGLMCKPMLVTLPLVLLALDRWPLQRTESMPRLILEKLPLFALSAASCAATLWAQTELIQPTALATPPLRIANALVAVSIYLRQLLWPSDLAVFYPFPYDGLAPWKPALALLLLVGISVGVFRWRRRQPWLLTGWLWYLIMLLPVLGFVQVGRQAHADRYAYLPQIGLCIAITWALAEWLAKWQVNRIAIGTSMAAVVVILTACSWKQTTYWQNSETLWARDLACTDRNEVAHFMLGDALSRQQDGLANAMAQFRDALEIDETYEPAQESLGLALLQQGKVDEAMGHLQSAVKLSGGDATALYDFGNAFLQKGRFDDAITQYRQALEVRPDYAEARNNLGFALLRKGHVDEAIAQCQQAVELRPDIAEIHISLGNALCQKGRLDEGIAQYKAALEINPGSADAKNNLDTALKRTGAVKY